MIDSTVFSEEPWPSFGEKPSRIWLQRFLLELIHFAIGSPTCHRSLPCVTLTQLAAVSHPKKYTSAAAATPSALIRHKKTLWTKRSVIADPDAHQFEVYADCGGSATEKTTSKRQRSIETRTYERAHGQICPTFHLRTIVTTNLL